eukprot:scaffold682618_cov43-Prasinocladus_malaysianus.AAC.1
MEAERAQALAEERAKVSSEITSSIDEEVVMRALRRAGLVQDELRKGMSGPAKKPKARKVASSGGRKKGAGRPDIPAALRQSMRAFTPSA